MSELKQKIWQEKYRPNTVKNVITPHKEKILRALENPFEIQNFIFHSKVPGTGKSSMAKAIINDLKCDYLMMNASADRSIESIRSKVRDFCVTQAVNTKVKKCVWMDEGEKLSKDALDALKNMVEEVSSNAFFIMTTNNLNKIPEAIQSRFNVLEFVSPDKTEVVAYLENICKLENIKYDVDGLNEIVHLFYPSLRKMVNKLQDLSLDNKPLTKQNLALDESNSHLFKLLLDQNFMELRRIVIEDSVDVEELNSWIVYNSSKLINNVLKEQKVIQICASNEINFRLGADANIVFIASIPKLIAALNG